MFLDDFKKANSFCIFGVIISLGNWLFWLIPSIGFGFSLMYFLFDLPPLLLSALSIAGIIFAKNGRILGFTLCIISGAVGIIFGILSGFILLHSSTYLFIFNFMGPLLILIGGINGFKMSK